MTRFKLKVNPPSADKKARQNALARERMKKYRERLKEDGARYEAHKNKEAERRKAKVSSETPEEIERRKELGRIRQRKYQLKKNEERSSVKKIQTRAGEEKQRQAWRERKNRWRANLTAQKRRRIKEKDREYRKAKRARFDDYSVTAPVETTPNSTPETAYSSSAKRKAIERARKALPKEPQKLAAVLQGIVTRATSPEKQALQEQGVSVNTCAEVKKRLAFEKISQVACTREGEDSRNEKSRKVKRALAKSMGALKKYRLMRTASRETGMSWNYLMKHSKRTDTTRKARSDKTDPDIVSRVKQFFLNHQISTPVPNTAMYHGKLQDETPTYILNTSVAQAYKIYKEENPDDRISSSTFVQCRPGHVLPVANRKHIQCLCEYCANVEELLKTTNKQCHKLNQPKLVIRDKSDVLKLTLCPREDGRQFHNAKCYQRECSECSVDSVREHFGPVVDASRDQELYYYQWVNERFEGKTRKVYKKISASLAEIIDLLCEQLRTLSKHLFVAYWQLQMFANLKQDIKPKHVLSVIDFSENYNTFHQNEIQSQHWVNNQVTLFPMVTWYRCDSCHQDPAIAPLGAPPVVVHPITDPPVVAPCDTAPVMTPRNDALPAMAPLGGPPAVAPPIDAPPAVAPPIDAPPAVAPPIDAPPAVAPPIDAPPAVAPPIDAPPAVAPPIDAPPAVAPPIDAPPAVAPPIDAPPAVAPPIDAPPAVAPPIDAPPAVAPPIDAPLAVAPPIDAPPAVAPPIDAPPAEAPPIDAQPTVVPAADQPVIREYIIILSNDLKHDAHAVHRFQQVAYEHLQQRRGVDIQTVIEFSDGAFSQFKSKTPFRDLSESVGDFGFQIQRNFFGSRHGKNDSDGAAGVIKRLVKRAVLSEATVIDSAMSMFIFLDENHTKPAHDNQGRCNHVRRHFVYVPSEEIDRNRPSRVPEKGLPGTRQLHSVAPQNPGTILARELSCYCAACYSGCTEAQCINEAYTKPWEERALTIHRRRHRRQPPGPAAAPPVLPVAALPAALIPVAPVAPVAALPVAPVAAIPVAPVAHVAALPETRVAAVPDAAHPTDIEVHFESDDDMEIVSALLKFQWTHWPLWDLNRILDKWYSSLFWLLMAMVSFMKLPQINLSGPY